jgi:hypothetical protein
VQRPCAAATETAENSLEANKILTWYTNAGDDSSAGDSSSAGDDSSAGDSSAEAAFERLIGRKEALNNGRQAVLAASDAFRS